MVRTAGWLLLACCLLLSAKNLLAAYPQNPLLAGESIYVSQQGVYKYRLNQPDPVWTSLAGIETFEPVFDGVRLLVGSTQGLYALDTKTGAIVWHIEKQHTIFTPALSQQAFAGSVHGELYSIETGSGEVLWRRAFPGWIYSPAINEESAKLWTGGQDHKVYALSLADGKQIAALSTTQELVFSPMDLGNNRIGINLFDGSTLIVSANGTTIEATLNGDSQPTGLQRKGRSIYRSHRDGSLSAFDFEKLKPRWRKSITAQDLTMHPARPGYLLLSDSDRNFYLLDQNQNEANCQFPAKGNWILPIQINKQDIVLFHKTMQPPGMRLVQIRAQCK